MGDAEEARAGMVLLLVVGLVVGVPATVMAVWTNDGTGAFWVSAVVAGVCWLMVLVSLVAYAVSLGRSASR